MGNSMKILYVTPTFQHPALRGSYRHYHILRELAKRHKITLLALERVPIKAEALQEMRLYTEQIVTFKTNGAAASSGQSLAKRIPVIGGRLAQQAGLRASVGQMRETLQRLARQERFDVALFHGKDCFGAIKDWHELPIVIDFCDATSFRIRTKMRHVNPAMALALGMRYLQVRSVERKMVQFTRHVAFISQRDRDVILGPNSGAEIIPNGLDIDYWTRRTRTPQPHTLIFTGVMDYSPNEDAALRLIDNVLPLLRPAVPDVRIILAGRNPTQALLRRAEAHPEVTVTGFVEDLRDYLEQAAVFVAPLRYASGMQNKLQEALAMEIPIVTTSIAAEGLRAADGVDVPVYVADQDEAFARRVVELLGRPDEQKRLAIQGRVFAQEHFSWVRSAEQFERMCLQAISA